MGQGGLAEYAVAEPKLLARLPDGVDFVAAASLPRAALTAWQAVMDKGIGKMEYGMKVLVTGATGAVGRMGVQILKDMVGGEGTVIAVGGKGAEELKQLGADVVTNYKENSNWDTDVGKVDWIFDCVGGKTLEQCLKAVKDGGQVVTVGTPIPVWEKVEGWEAAKSRSVDAVFFIVEENGKQLGQIGKMVETGFLKTSVSLIVYPLTEGGVRDGWAKAEKGGLSGSVVVKIL